MFYKVFRWISWNPHEICQISWNPHEICQISWNPLGFVKSAWNLLDFMKSTWNLPDFVKSTWNPPDFKIMSFWIITKYRSFFRKTNQPRLVFYVMEAKATNAWTHHSCAPLKLSLQSELYLISLPGNEEGQIKVKIQTENKRIMASILNTVISFSSMGLNVSVDRTMKSYCQVTCVLFKAWKSECNTG